MIRSAKRSHGEPVRRLYFAEMLIFIVKLKGIVITSLKLNYECVIVMLYRYRVVMYHFPHLTQVTPAM